MYAASQFQTMRLETAFVLNVNMCVSCGVGRFRKYVVSNVTSVPRYSSRTPVALQIVSRLCCYKPLCGLNPLHVSNSHTKKRAALPTCIT
jgi:hypothetical protein